MSFGYEDEDWVDPDEGDGAPCCECECWEPCPCGCGEGWCERMREFTRRDEACG